MWFGLVDNSFYLSLVSSKLRSRQSRLTKLRIYLFIIYFLSYYYNTKSINGITTFSYGNAIIVIIAAGNDKGTLLPPTCIDPGIPTLALTPIV